MRWSIEPLERLVEFMKNFQHLDNFNDFVQVYLSETTSVDLKNTIDEIIGNFIFSNSIELYENLKTLIEQMGISKKSKLDDLQTEIQLHAAKKHHD